MAKPPSILTFYPATAELEPSFVERTGIINKEYYFRVENEKKNIWVITVFEMRRYPVNEYKISTKGCTCFAGNRNLECKHKEMLKTVLQNKQTRPN